MMSSSLPGLAIPPQFEATSSSSSSMLWPRSSQSKKKKNLSVEEVILADVGFSHHF